MTRKLTVLDLCICASCVALHVILELFCAIRIGNDIKITFAALPIVIAAFLCGPLEGFLTGLVGTFLSQLLTFGITATTVFWIIPPSVQGLLCGLTFIAFKRKLKVVTVGASVFISGLASAVLTWGASYLDGVVFFKYITTEALCILIPWRLLVWVGISAVYTLVSLPVIKALWRKSPAAYKMVAGKKRID